MKTVKMTVFLALAAGTACATVTNDVAFTATHDKSEQRYVQILPDGFDPAQAHDLLICLHGHGSDRWQYVNEARSEARAARDAAAQNQMIFVSPDYRAKTSWMGPAAEADMLQLIGDFKKRYAVKRVILSGGSMGASSALTFTALHPELIDGVVALNGLADHRTYTNFQDAIAASFGGTKTAVPEEYRTRSAMNFPEHFMMPLAVTAGGKDATVPPESVLKLARAVRARNPFVRVDFLPQRGHETDYDASFAAYQFVIHVPRAKTACATVELNGKPLFPAHATTAGVWFYAGLGIRSEVLGGETKTLNAERSTPNAEVLLTGHGTVPDGWRLTASLNKGDELRVVLDPGASPLSDICFQADALSGQALTCRAESNAVVIRARHQAWARCGSPVSRAAACR